MAKKNGNDHSDVQRQEKYPMPGTDLGMTTAIPYNEAYDVDMPEGSPGLSGDGPVSTHSFYDPKKWIKPASNPTRWD